MKLHTIGDCHADRPWYFIDPSSTPFEEIECNGMHYGIYDIGHKRPIIIDITGSYWRAHPTPSININVQLQRENQTFPYEQFYNIKDGDAVVFAFGEIDCRLIYSFTGHSETWRDMANEDVHGYFEVIKLNVEKFNHLHTMVYNIIPPSKHKDMPTYPVEGTDETRRDVTLYVNNKFKEYCEKYNYMYFDIYDKHCDDDGFMIPELSDGANHIFTPIYHTEFLNNLKF